jgi:ubiquinone/menaquinone biosynthesis C-methylase UbiE
MSFAVSADAYDGYMGRYSRKLAPLLAGFAGVERGHRLLDVGCGPGALSAELALRVGARGVAAADPSPGFARACTERVAGADVRTASAEELPWAAGCFDRVLSQLVVSFLIDPDAGVREMRRVARRGGIVASCTRDYRGQMQMLRIFWDAALALDAAAPDEARAMAFTDPVSLREPWMGAGIASVETVPLVVHSDYADYEDYWRPFLTGTGPGGQYCVSLDIDHRAALREDCFRRLGAPLGPFTLSARARSWAVRGVA